MDNPYDAVAQENAEAVRDAKEMNEELLGEETEPEQPFPDELDVEIAVKRCLDHGVNLFILADAIIAGFKNVDPFKLEQMADHIMDTAVKMQSEKQDLPL